MASAVRVLALCVSGLLASCGGAAPSTTPNEPLPLAAAPVVTVPAQGETSAPSPEASGRSGVLAPAPRDAQPVGAPPGYVEMTVIGVAPTADGDAVLLTNIAKNVVVPIFVGGTEALSIQLRQRREHYQRPLTHDLLDAIMHELGASLVKVHVDDIKNNTFLGTVFVRTGNRVFELDARPSDAIALAIGNRVPIFVAQRVIDEAGIQKDPASNAPIPGTVPRI
jgi:uncharacterized protein